MGTGESDVIVHQTAVEHAAKLLRIFRNGNAHMVLLGGAGSGRNVICRIAVSIFNHHLECSKSIDELKLALYHLNTKRADSLETVEKQLRNLFDRCKNNRILCLVLADRKDRINEHMLEILNSIITNGTIDGYYPCSNLNQNWTKIRDNLHFVVCAPMESEQFR